jgi:hypothetical protein
MSEAGPLSGQQLELQERLRYDTVFWGRNCATILNPRKQPVRLEARPWQVDFDRRLEAQRAAGRPMRAIILKARKLGFSTWVTAKGVQRVTQLPYQYMVSIAHLQSAAGQLMDMARLMYDNLPTQEELGLDFSIRPQIVGQGQTRNGARFLSLGDKRRPTEASVVETMTAGAKGGGRASTPSVMHFSEPAHYDDPDFITGALSALPLEPETIGVLESTAKGFNHFFTIWDNAVRGAEDPETGILWEPLFYGWQDNPFNALAFISEQARERFERTLGDEDGGGDEEELVLVETFGVTLEQLNWRRQILNGPECRGSVDNFHQEHPATPEQAFIGSGSPVFPGILVARAIKAAEMAPEPVSGVLRGVDIETVRTRAGSIEVPRRAIWVPGDRLTAADMDRWGMDRQLAVWEHPVNERTQEGVPELERQPDGQYVAFADIALGQGATSGPGDWHAVQVIDHVTGLQVARYRSKIPLHDLPYALLLIALYWNEAWLAPEVNGPGIGVVDALVKDYRYRRMYRRRRAGDDRRQDQREQLIGWQTDLRTKPLMEMTFGEALKDGTHGLRDVATAREATTYVEDPKNAAKHGAQKGAHDDLLMAYMGGKRVAAELRPRSTDTRGGRMSGFSVGDDTSGY